MSGDKNYSKKAIQWGCDSLDSLGYTLKSNLPECVKNTPWSYVARFETTNGYIYLKQTPKLIAMEATIIQMLHNQFNAHVAEIVAHNMDLNCFLMKDAGRPLREILKQKFDNTLLYQAIDQFTLLQLVVADSVTVFLDIGVPDWRLDKLPDLFMEVLSRNDILIADGLSDKEISELKTLQPIVSKLCQKLSAYAIKETIVQPDFHDNNLLIEGDSQVVTLIDLGEIVISHPFFSLLGCLQQVQRHHGLTEKDDVYLKIVDACFNNYISYFETEAQLSNAVTIAKSLLIVYGILSQYRLMLACGEAKIIAYQHGNLRNSMREFSTVCELLDSDML